MHKDISVQWNWGKLCKIDGTTNTIFKRPVGEYFIAIPGQSTILLVTKLPKLMSAECTTSMIHCLLNHNPLCVWLHQHNIHDYIGG